MASSKQGSKKIAVKGKSYLWSVLEIDGARILTVTAADDGCSFKRVYSKAGDTRHKELEITPSVVRGFIGSLPSQVKSIKANIKRKLNDRRRMIVRRELK